MRLAFEWIREYAAVGCSPEELARTLTAAGLAVDRLEKEGGEHFLELDITSNRPDCMNLYGVCREAAAHTGTPLRKLRPKVREADPRINTRARVTVKEPSLCPRYSARVILGIRVTPSPSWIQKRLLAMGLRPINLIVDLTNYVLMELGQPLHAFDLDLLEDRRIIVRRARAGEPLTTLDGIDRRLHRKMLVIADGRKAVALAGVMGGQETEIREDTRNILLESAHFDPVSVRRTAKTLGLRTEASLRFERGTDPEITCLALDRFCELLLTSGKGTVARGTLDLRSRPKKPRVATIRADRISRLLGDRIRVTEISRALSSLGFSPRRKGRGEWSVTVPSFRSDIEEEVDFIEEVARFRGYDRIPSRLPILPGRGVGRSRTSQFLRRVKGDLTGIGYQEVINLSMIDPVLEERFAGDPRDRLGITNPLSDRASVLRRSLIPGLLENLSFNWNRGIQDLKLFEVGRVFRAAPRRTLPREDHLLGMAATGSALPVHWNRPSGPYSFFHLKGTLESLLDRFGIRQRKFRPGNRKFLDPDHQAELIAGGKVCGYLGRLGGNLLGGLELDPTASVFVAEVDLDTLLRAPTEKTRYRPVPRHPSVRRDLSLIVGSQQSYEKIERVIRNVDGKRVLKVEIFDRFRPPGLPEGKVSLGVRIEYQRPDRTLLKEEVSAIEERILERLRKELGITLRGTPESGLGATG